MCRAIVMLSRFVLASRTGVTGTFHNEIGQSPTLAKAEFAYFLRAADEGSGHYPARPGGPP
jgi:hypothetical protein